MNKERLRKNIIDQIKEAQIKLGYEKETMRLYYPTASLNALLGIKAAGTGEMLELLKEEFAAEDADLGELHFAVSGKRIEISIPPKGASYVQEKTGDAPFLRDLIALFGNPHACTLEKICQVFERYSKDYVCEKMPQGMDFDYALHFSDASIDEYYYCVKEEMGHTIYHRFMKEDYEMLFL